MVLLIGYVSRMEPTTAFTCFADAYVDAMRGELRDHARCVVSFRHLARFFGGRSVADIGRRDVGEYIVQRKRSGVCNRTINRELFALSAAYRYAGRYWAWEVAWPGRELKLKEPEGRLRYLERQEAQRLLAAASVGPEYLADFIRLALYTGCRKTEMLTLTWPRVDVHAKRLTVESHLSKTGKRRIVPLNRVALEALAGRREFQRLNKIESDWVFCHLNGRPVRNIYFGFHRAIKTANIEDFKVHDLRHTFASWLVCAGVPLTEIRGRFQV